MLFLPLLVLAVPILDTSFVVARRLKHRQPISSAGPVATCTSASSAVGFSQRRAAVTMWAWCATLAGGGARDAVHPVPRGRRVAPLARRRVTAAIAVVALGFSIYIVYLLEIVKLANPRMRREDRGRGAPQPPLGLAARES